MKRRGYDTPKAWLYAPKAVRLTVRQGCAGRQGEQERGTGKAVDEPALGEALYPGAALLHVTSRGASIGGFHQGLHRSNAGVGAHGGGGHDR